MQIRVEVPEPAASSSPLLEKRLAETHRQFVRLVAMQQASSKSLHTLLLDAMRKQQDRLMVAMEHFLGITRKPDPSTHTLVASLKGMQQTMAGLPGLLAKAVPPPPPKIIVRPQITVTTPPAKAPAVSHGLDKLEASLLAGMRRFRTRTFGSNY